jgi:hypothetical protein
VKISSARIINYKSFADSGEVALGQVNILVGRNNHGKSAFIQAIHLLQQGAHIRGNDVRLGEEEASIELSLTAANQTDFQRYYEIDMNDTLLTPTINLARGGGLSIQTISEPNQGPSRNLKRFAAQEPDNFIYTYLSKRKVLGFDREVNRDRTRAVQIDLRNLVAKVSRLANPDYVHAVEYDELCKAVLGFRISVHAAEDGNGQQAGIPVGSFGYIPLESMGEGVSSQLGLITDLCMADSNLFLIEEPENDIHPEGLKTLLNVIVEKSKTNQFIVSTHSNIVTRYLGTASDSKIFEFESTFKPNEIPTSAIREVEPSPEARIAVLRRLGYELSDFELWDGWLILEESSAEIIIRYLIPWFVPGLARVRTVAAGGTSKVEPTFEDFRRLFLFAHLEPQYRGRAWVVVDGDDAGKAVIVGLKDKYKDWPPDHFTKWSQPDFERYYPPRFTEQVEETLTKDHDGKRKAKKKLLDKVKEWSNANPKEAKAEFEQSAAEVIKILHQIEADLLQKR